AFVIRSLIKQCRPIVVAPGIVGIRLFLTIGLKEPALRIIGMSPAADHHKLAVAARFYAAKELGLQILVNLVAAVGAPNLVGISNQVVDDYPIERPGLNVTSRAYASQHPPCLRVEMLGRGSPLIEPNTVHVFAPPL